MAVNYSKIVTLLVGLKSKRRPKLFPVAGPPLKRTYFTEGHDIGYTTDEVEFMMAMDKFKRDHDRPFPYWHEVLRVLKELGYTRAPQS